MREEEDDKEEEEESEAVARLWYPYRRWAISLLLFV
jgi:hypothetical protein